MFPNWIAVDPPSELGIVVSTARYVQVPVGGVRFQADSFERPETRLVMYEGDHTLILRLDYYHYEAGADITVSSTGVCFQLFLTRFTHHSD